MCVVERDKGLQRRNFAFGVRSAKSWRARDWPNALSHFMSIQFHCKPSVRLQTVASMLSDKGNNRRPEFCTRFCQS